MKCTQCGGIEFEEDRGRADLICMNCGFVAGESTITAEVEFVETSAGTASAIGRFVSDESQFSENRASRQQTEANAKRRIETICGQLRLGHDVITSAFRFYQTALFRGLTRGKQSFKLAAACIYLAARQLRTNLILLDLSDVVCINVFALGNCFNELRRKLCLSIPEADPCLLVERYANQLEFGDKAKQVSTTAMRLLQRMTKDWISVGRRPSGIAAASLLVAARIHEFNRTEEDVCRVARVSQSTTKKRLSEFSKTASSALSIDDFFTVDYEQEEDPPAYREATQKAQESVITQIDHDQMHRLQLEISMLGKRIDQELDQLSAKKTSGGLFKSSLTKLGIENSKGLDHLFKDKETDAVAPACTSAKDSLKREILMDVFEGVIEPELLDTCADDAHLVTTCSGDTLCDLVTSIEQLRDYQDEEGIQEQQPTGEQESTCSSSQLDLKLPPGMQLTDKPIPPDLKLQLKLPAMLPSAKLDPCTSQLPELQIDTTLKYDDIDDTELDNEYLLERREVMIKAVVWFKENTEFIEHRRKARAEKRRLEVENKAKPKRTRRPRSQVHARADQQASERLDIKAQQKQSRKINYSALDDLKSQLLGDSIAESSPVIERQPDEPGPVLTATLNSNKKKSVRIVEPEPEEEEPVLSEAELDEDEDDEPIDDEDWQHGAELW